MGEANREVMRLEDIEAQGIGVLVRAGVVRECDGHCGIYVNQDSSAAVNKAAVIATEMVEAGEVDATRGEFMNLIKIALENTVDECPICANIRGE